MTPGSGNAYTDTWIFHCSHKVCESSAFPPRVSIRESGTALRMHLAPRIALTSAPPQIIKNSDQKALTQPCCHPPCSGRTGRQICRVPKDQGNDRVLMNTRLFDMDSERCEIGGSDVGLQPGGPDVRRSGHESNRCGSLSVPCPGYHGSGSGFLCQALKPRTVSLSGDTLHPFSMLR